MDLAIKIDPIWKKKDSVGIDIGTHSIKAVQLKKKGKFTKLVAYGKIDLPENYVIEGIIAEPEKVGKLISDLLSSSSEWGTFSAKRVYTSMSESKIFTRILTLPKMNNKELEEAISWEASQYLPMALTDLYLDWKVVGPNADNQNNNDIIFAAAPKSIVDSFIQTFNLAKLEVVGLEPSLTAISRAMIPQKEKNQTVLVIDIVADTTNIAIFDNVIRVTGSTLVGGKDLITADQTAAVNATDSIKKKSEYKLSPAAEGGLAEIVTETKKMIRYFGEKSSSNHQISNILLCGGAANLPGLTEYFTTKVGIPTVIGNPWANISVYPIKPVPKNEAPGYTNAIGLALAGLEDD